MMFEYKNIVTCDREWFNTEHVLLVKKPQGDVRNNHKILEIEFVNGSSILITSYWENRDDVARFKEAMGMMEEK